MEQRLYQSRRAFIGQSIACIASSWLLGCGQDDSALELFSTSQPEPDIYIRQVGGIPLNALNGKQDLELSFWEPYHKHRLVLTKAQQLAVNNGELLRLTTEETNGHDHTVSVEISNTKLPNLTDFFAYDQDDKSLERPLGVVTAKQIQTGQPVTIKLEAPYEGVLLTLSQADLFALRGDVSVFSKFATPAGEQQIVFRQPPKEEKKNEDV